MNNKLLNKIICILFLCFVSSGIALDNALAESALYEIRANKVSYKNNNNLIIATGSAEAIDKFGKEIFSNKITYDKKNSTIITNGNSIYLDGKGNRLFADTFFYDLNTKVIEAKQNVQYIDTDGNIFEFSTFEYNEISENGSGTNLVASLENESSAESEMAEIDNKNALTIMRSSNHKKGYSNFIKTNKNFYTACKNIEKSKKTIEERCADWSITSQKTKHDKNERMLYHDNAVIKLRNIPVFYTPYFSHPDPSVKRKSGFLPPSIKSFTNLGKTFKTPYFLVIDDSRDLTFTPIFYFQENSIFLTEYRQQNKQSQLFIDSSYSQGYKKLNKKDKDGNLIPRTSGSRNHFYLGFAGQYKNLLLTENDLSINIQRISQKNYFKVNQLNTEFIKEDDTYLKNNIKLNSYAGSKNIGIEAVIYESLGTDARNEKYSYTIPDLRYSDFFRQGFYNFDFSNSFNAVNSGGDSNKSNQINVINLQSDEKVYKILDGVSHVFKSSLSNINSYSQNISGEKKNFSSDANIIFGLENAYPLLRYNKDLSDEEILTPKIFTKYTPGDMLNESNTGKIINYGDVYSMNRADLSNPDVGLSMGYGLEYGRAKKNTENEVYMSSSFEVGQVLRAKKLKEMQASSTLGETKSDFAGNFSFDLNLDRKNLLDTSEYYEEGKVEEQFNINYNYILNNNFNKILRSDFSVSYMDTKNTIIGKYYETHDIGNSQVVDLSYTKKFDNLLNISLGIKKDLESKFTESNHIDVYYDSDCLRLGARLAKQFYATDDIKRSNSFIISLTLKPFGSPIAPSLTSLINNN
jgi:LPS-assembly protein